MSEEKSASWKDAADGKLAGEAPIQNAYSFSYIKRNSGSKGAGEVESYEKSIKDLGEFKTVQGFWRVYNHLLRPNDLPNSMEYHLFKSGIKPMWEDAANRKGGKWMVRVRKGVSSRYWEDLILAIIGEQFDVGNEICGAVVSIRYSEDVISLWNRNADNNEACYRIRDTMRKVLNLPQFISLEYRRHDTSLSDTGATRNNNNNNNTQTSGAANTNTNVTNNTGGGNNNNPRDSSSTTARDVWREQRSSSERSNHRDGADGQQPQRERGSGRFTRGNSDRAERGDRGDRGERGERGDRADRGDRGERGERGDRSGNSSSTTRSAWSRDGKRPAFNKTDAGESSSSSNSTSRPSGGEGKRSPRSNAPPTNAWQQK